MGSDDSPGLSMNALRTDATQSRPYQWLMQGSKGDRRPGKDAAGRRRAAEGRGVAPPRPPYEECTINRAPPIVRPAANKCTPANHPVSGFPLSLKPPPPATWNLHPLLHRGQHVVLSLPRYSYVVTQSRPYPRQHPFSPRFSPQCSPRLSPPFFFDWSHEYRVRRYGSDG
jgi:hypothetical protein